MKTDDLGEYNENVVPQDMKLPLKLDRDNDAISGDDNNILARFNFSSETVLAGFARRRGEFLVRLANGEIMVDNGVVYLRTGKQYQNGRFVVTYDAVGTVKEEVNGSKSGQKQTLSPEYFKNANRK